MKVKVNKTTTEDIEFPNGYFEKYGICYRITDAAVTSVSDKFCAVHDREDLSTNTIANLLVADKSTEEVYGKKLNLFLLKL